MMNLGQSLKNAWDMIAGNKRLEERGILDENPRLRMNFVKTACAVVTAGVLTTAFARYTGVKPDLALQMAGWTFYSAALSIGLGQATSYLLARRHDRVRNSPRPGQS